MFEKKKMKNFVFCIVFFCILFEVKSQINLSIELDHFNPNDTTSNDPLDLQFIIHNEGPSDWDETDTLFFAYSINSNMYDPFSLNLGYAFEVLWTTIPVGSQFTYMAPISDPTMSWLHGAIGSNAGNVCVFASIGENGLFLDSTYDTDYSDNFACVYYKVLASSSPDENFSVIKVYPNPAKEVIYFSLGNSGVTSMEIIEITGKIVKTVSINQATGSISLDGMSQGVYFYKLYSGEEVISCEKLIITQ